MTKNEIIEFSELPFEKRLAINLRNARLLATMSQDEATAQLSFVVTRERLSLIENGRRRVQVEELIQMCELYKISFEHVAYSAYKGEEFPQVSHTTMRWADKESIES